MKKLIAWLIWLVSVSVAGPIATSFYATPTTTTNYNTATVKILGTKGTISANGGIVTLGTVTANKVALTGAMTISGNIGGGGAQSLIINNTNSSATNATFMQFLDKGTSLGYIGGLGDQWAYQQGVSMDMTVDSSKGVSIFSKNGKDIKFFTGGTLVTSGTQRMTIQDGGNVGIGTTAPSTKLEVAGTVSASSVVANGNIFAGSGYVNPTYPVTIQGTTSSDSMLFIGSKLNAVGERTGILFGTTGSTSLFVKNGIYSVPTDGSYNRGQIRFALNDAANSGSVNGNPGDWETYTKMNIDYSGNVGIGTGVNAASTKLEVAGTVSANQLDLNGSINPIPTKLNGATGTAAHIQKGTASIAGGVASTINVLVGSSRGTVVFVQGDDASNFFTDLVSYGNAGSVVVISSGNIYGSPSARTYTVVGAALKLSMGSGTYNTRCLPFEFY